MRTFQGGPCLACADPHRLCEASGALLVGRPIFVRDSSRAAALTTFVSIPSNLRLAMAQKRRGGRRAREAVGLKRRHAEHPRPAFAISWKSYCSTVERRGTLCRQSSTSLEDKPARSEERRVGKECRS